MDNYIMFEGQKIPLTDEQVEMIKSCADKKKSPFERVEYNQRYYYIDAGGTVSESTDGDFADDNECFNAANYCTDEELMEQRALHETLNRLLWRFSMENGEGERLWDNDHAHWYIEYSHVAGTYHVRWVYNMHGIGIVHFPSAEIAQRAVVEIIEPFTKKHPDFVM